jgi:hypothetical protein
VVVPRAAAVVVVAVVAVAARALRDATLTLPIILSAHRPDDREPGSELGLPVVRRFFIPRVTGPIGLCGKDGASLR